MAGHQEGAIAMTTKPRNPRSGAAHSGADAPPPQPSGAPIRPPADGPTAAVWAALTANPGATAAQIAAAAGTSRAVTSRELTALQTTGRATRTPGTSTGRGPAPATWHPATAVEPARPGSGGPGTGSPSAADGSPELATEPEASGASADPDREPETTSPATAGAGDAAATVGTSGLGRTAADYAPAAAPGETGSADTEHATRPAGPDDTASPDSGTDSSGEAEPPAVWGEAAQLLDELAAAALQAAAALRDGQIGAALPAIEAITGTAAQARRLVRSAASGRRTRGSGAARPGQLRDLVAGHLAAYPDAEFTPHAVGRVLGRSSGAVANALDRLTALGQAQLTSEHPRRYKAFRAAQSYLDA
jgi:hypothetical protein